MSRTSHRLAAGMVAGVALLTLSGSIAPTGPDIPDGSGTTHRTSVPALYDDSMTNPTRRDAVAVRGRFPSFRQSPSYRDEASLEGAALRAASAHRTPAEPTVTRRAVVTATGVKTTRPRFRVFSRPRWSSTSHTIAAKNPIDQHLVLLVNRAARDGRWLRILLPERPNGSMAWVRSDAVKVVRLDQRIVVDLSDRRLKHFRKGRLVNEYVVAIGTRATPTPKGTFYVWARVPQPEPTGPYGNYVLGLSGFSPVLTDWPGGGRSAIHGTPRPSDRGQAVSHGCVRVYNADMRRLTRVPMGTPVLIRK